MCGLKEGGNGWIDIYGGGYEGDDKGCVGLKCFMLGVDVVNGKNEYEGDRLCLYWNLGLRRVKKGEMEIGEVNVKGLGEGGDFVGFGVVGDVGYGLEDGSDL